MRPTHIHNATITKRAVAAGIDICGKLTGPFNNYGLNRATRMLAKLLPPHQICDITINSDTVFRVCLDDPYWSRMLTDKYDYEDEISFVLKLFEDVDYCLVDCGANFGYWSLIATSRHFGKKTAVAIEPLPSTFKYLEQNRSLNGERFIAIQKAIGCTSGDEVSLSYPAADLSCTGATIVRPDDNASDELRQVTVQTVTIDSVVNDHAPKNACLIVKLDIEGMELPSLAGATDTLNRDVLIIFEEHGKHADAPVVKHMLQEGFDVFFVEPRRRTVTQIRNEAEAICSKPSPSRGYNFFATKRPSVFQKELANAAMGAEAKRQSNQRARGSRSSL